MLSLTAKEKSFRAYKAGDDHALAELLEMERAGLYDYVIRMTGQVSRSVESIDEVFMSFQSGAAKNMRGISEFRLHLYRTARNFNLDIWNADTSKLTNLALENSDEGTTKSKANPADLRKLETFLALDRSLRKLVGPQREGVILRSRCGFHFAEMAEVTSVALAEAEQRFDKGMQIIDAECSGIVERPEEALSHLPNHPVPMQTIQDTMSLSIIMEDIKASPTGLRSPTRIVMLILLVAAGIGYFFFPEYFVVPEEYQFWKK